MSLTPAQRDEIRTLLNHQVEHKLSAYTAGAACMPFHDLLLGHEHVAPYSLVHSFATTLGTSVYRPVARIIAAPHFPIHQLQYRPPPGTISAAAQEAVGTILNDLRTGHRVPNCFAEAIDVAAAAGGGADAEGPPPPAVDLHIADADGNERWYALRTVKPNSGDFRGFKQTLLQWASLAAAGQAQSVRRILALPYNPCGDTDEYNHQNVRTYFDMDNEVLVGSFFWDSLGGDDTYSDLLDVFDEVGQHFRPQISTLFGAVA